MQWKQFLKPDWRKNIAFFILIFIVLNDTVIFQKFDEIWYVLYITQPFYKALRICYSFSGSCHKMIEGIAAPLVPITRLFDILYLYLLSCLIIWIYDKVKKK